PKPPIVAIMQNVWILLILAALPSAPTEPGKAPASPASAGTPRLFQADSTLPRLPSAAPESAAEPAVSGGTLEIIDEAVEIVETVPTAAPSQSDAVDVFRSNFEDTSDTD